MKITVGVHVHTDPSRLDATLTSVARNTTREHELIVIPDGADFRPQVDTRVLDDPGPRGGAACVNRLAKSTGADLLVLLESGALVAPRWLDHLVTALESSPRAGLAGPSTNRFWNEQGAFANASKHELDAIGAEAERRFGTLSRTLAPLYSLGDFCYAVKREVFDTIGDADEAYGLGPCWEMDFNARAARAGFDGLWVCASYVWRAPFTNRRSREESARFEVNRRRYQDKFCGARLRGEKRDYRQHCRGDACPNFAPRASTPLPASVHVAGEPLVSCIMPTFNRRPFIPLALQRFREQSYANRELIVVDDGSDAIGDLVQHEPAVRYIRLDRRTSIGAKRNLACAEARGEIVAHWDDDDWYSHDRLARQAAPILRGEADVTGLENRFVLQMPLGRFWTTNRQLHRSMFVCDVHGGTLVFRRSLWTAGIRYPEVNLAEDAAFVRDAVRRGKRLARIDNDGTFVYVRHRRNAWQFDTGTFLDPSGWSETAPPHGFSAECLQAYRAAAGT